MDTEKRLKEFQNELNLIKDVKVRALAEKLLTECDEYFFTTPASTSGKYHPMFSLGTGGLVRHTKAVVYFLNELLRSGQFNIDEKQGDLLIMGAIAHDIKKLGNDSSVHTVKEHPLCASQFIKECNDKFITKKEEEYVCKAVESHMGIWGEKDGLPIPKTESEKALHLADLIASRKEIDLKIFDSANIVTERASVNEERGGLTNVDANFFTMPFGKYRGKTFKQIDEENSGYLDWAVKNLESTDIVELIKTYRKNLKNG